MKIGAVYHLLVEERNCDAWCFASKTVLGCTISPPPQVDPSLPQNVSSEFEAEFRPRMYVVWCTQTPLTDRFFFGQVKLGLVEIRPNLLFKL